MNEKFYHTLSVVFCVLVVLSSVIASKLFPSPVFPSLALSSSIVVYPFTYLISSLVTEIFGANRARQIILMGFSMCVLTQLIFTVMLMLPNHHMTNQNALESVFQLSQVALFSSMIICMIGQFLNIYLYNSIYQWTGNKHLWLRVNMSSSISQAYDTMCVTSLFYYFGVPLPIGDIVKLVVISYLFKVSIGMVMTPIYYQCVKFMKKNRDSSISLLNEQH